MLAFSSRRTLVALAGLALFALLATPAPVAACGCFSPQQPPPGEVDFAVDQESEQIIFEVPGDGTITAHVLIRYQGKPESFAWLVPVPTAPELALSETFTFATLDRLTGPIIDERSTNLCPGPAFECEYHAACAPTPYCPGAAPPAPDTPIALDLSADFAASDGGTDAGAPPVDVLGRETIGSYDTITFAAGDAAAAVVWLRDNGFLVNETTAPFMQPYADAGMVFVASRLVPGADVDEIRPLRMTYEAEEPMVPLRLTAIGAQPHLTVTSYIYAPVAYEPRDHPLLTLPAGALTFDPNGRDNYGQVLARAVDDAGGDGFVEEFGGRPPGLDAFSDGRCCGGGSDNCGIAADGLCQCPADDFDAEDCGEEIVAGVELLGELATRHARVTRLTTRISAEEMTFDPAFRIATRTPANERLRLSALRFSLNGCATDVVDQPAFVEAVESDLCSAVYCGRGECVVTDAGTAACACDAGFVARQFQDLDGASSVTCVPDTPPVDLEAGGVDLPTSCGGIDCGDGTCVDLNGFPSCACAAGAAASVSRFDTAPTCRAIARRTGSPGAERFTAALADLDVCAPVAPACREGGWLVPAETTGIACARNAPDPARLVVPPAPDCNDDLCLDRAGNPVSRDAWARRNDGCSAAATSAPWLILGLWLWMRRRR
ncbi:MAG: DUF2330 domain-containing protein [Myxococcota bacterium]